MPSILIADDEPRISGFIEKGLRAAGFATRVAGTGPDALAFALSDEFDLMVLDVNLPGFDGFHVLEQFRGSGSTMPAISTSMCAHAAHASVTPTWNCRRGSLRWPKS